MVWLSQSPDLNIQEFQIALRETTEPKSTATVASSKKKLILHHITLNIQMINTRYGFTINN